MIITIAVTVCHLAAPAPAPQEGMNVPPERHVLVNAADIKLCHEEIAFEGEGSMQACLSAQPAVADWKMKSEYADDGWTIERLRCIPGHYVKKDAI